jgi:hypothetical protein
MGYIQTVRVRYLFGCGVAANGRGYNLNSRITL